MLDHSGDLLPTYQFWRDSINRRLPTLRSLVKDKTIVLLRGQLVAVMERAEQEQLSLYRNLFRA